MITYRPATTAEIFAARAVEIRLGWKVSFRHFVLEALHAKAKNGVMHKTHSRATIRVVDGQPAVRHHGKIEMLAATMMVFENGKEVLIDLRLASPYLPALFG